jgi:predicted deacetylase
MIDEKLAIITIHDVNPSHSEDILTVTERLNTLKVKYNLSIVPYYNKEYNLKNHRTSVMKSLH